MRQNNMAIGNRTVGMFCIFAATLYYICLMGKMIFDSGFLAFSRFSFIFEGMTFVTIINPIIIPLWYLNTLEYQVLSVVNFFGDIAVLLAPLFLFVGGIGMANKRRWGRVILILYACYWGLTCLSIAIIKVVTA